MRTWATITSVLFFIAAFGAGLAGDAFNSALLAFSGGLWIGTAIS
jgi:hypothetical protein